MSLPGHSAWLTGLLVAWFGLLYGGFAFGKSDAPDDRRMPVWTRISSSTVLVIASWSWFGLAMGSDAKTYAFLIATGMSLGFLGDLVLARLIPVGGRAAMGMALFGLGHAAYILAFAGFIRSYSILAPGTYIGAWISWMIVGSTAWWLIVYRSARRTHFVWAGLIYSLALASMAGLATTLALWNANFAGTAIGASLFVVSDMLVAATLFDTFRFRLIHDIIWLTYGPAQMLIVYGVSAALGAVL